jgi:hypothetical protein
VHGTRVYQSILYRPFQYRHRASINPLPPYQLIIFDTVSKSSPQSSRCLVNKSSASTSSPGSSSLSSLSCTTNSPQRSARRTLLFAKIPCTYVPQIRPTRFCARTSHRYVRHDSVHVRPTDTSDTNTFLAVASLFYLSSPRVGLVPNQKYW